MNDWIAPTSVALVGLMISMGLAIASDRQQAANATNWARRCGIGLLGAGLGFLLTRTVETWAHARDAERTSTATGTELRSLAEEVRQSQDYWAARAEAARAPTTPFRALITMELDDTDARLHQIAHGTLRLKREEIIPRWEKLISSATKTVDATNIVSRKDWVEFSPSKGLEVHKKALESGVRVRRIMIYDDRDVGHNEGLQDLARPQLDMGVLVRRCSYQWIQQSSFLSEILRDLGTVDIVLFDSDTLLLTQVDFEKRMVSAQAVTDPHLLRKALTFYEKLWSSSEELTAPKGDENKRARAGSHPSAPPAISTKPQ